MMKAGVSAQDYFQTKEKNLEDMSEQELMEYRKQLQEEQNNTP